MIIPLLIGAVAIFIWSQFASKKPVEKTELLESPLPEKKDIMDVFKENAPKVAAIVSGAGAALAGVTTIGVTALPAATVLPAAVTGMVPVAPAAVGTGTGTASVGAGAGGTSGAGAALAGAAMVAAPLVIMPIITKVLDKIFPKHVITEEEQAAMDEAKAFRQLLQDQGVPLVKGYVPVDLG